MLNFFSTDEVENDNKFQRENVKHIGSSMEPQPAITCRDSTETDYSRVDSYQAFLVYPVNEFDAKSLWHSSLSVSLSHPIFTTVSAY